MRLKLAVVFILFFLFSCGAEKKTDSAEKSAQENKQENFNPNLPTVTLEKVKSMKLHSVLRYATYIKPRASYPVLQVADAVIRSIPVTVGTFVKEGDILYSFQQVLPGTSFGIGWVRAKNTGYISLIEGVEGHTVKKDEIVLVISDFNSTQMNFYLSNQDVGRVKDGQEVYFAEYIDQLDEIDQKLKLNLPQETRELFLKQREKVQQLLEDTKGKIIRMPIAPEKDLGVFNVQVDFPIHETLKIGRFVVIEMHVDPYEGLAVNQRNVQRRYGKYQVTVVRDNIVDYQEVEIGRSYGDMVVIKSGLQEGDEIVVATNRYVRPGSKVNVRRRKPLDLEKGEKKAPPEKQGKSPQKQNKQDKSQKLEKQPATQAQTPVKPEPTNTLEKNPPPAQQDEEKKQPAMQVDSPENPQPEDKTPHTPPPQPAETPSVELPEKIETPAQEKEAKEKTSEPEVQEKPAKEKKEKQKASKKKKTDKARES